MRKKGYKLMVRRETLRTLQVLDRQSIKRAIGADAIQPGEALAAFGSGTNTQSGEIAGCPLL